MPTVTGDPLNSERLLTADQVAEFLSISKPRAYEILRRKMLPTVRIGRQVRVALSALETYVRSGGIAHN